MNKTTKTLVASAAMLSAIFALSIYEHGFLEGVGRVAIIITGGGAGLYFISKWIEK